jgi:hypothetical protein
MRQVYCYLPDGIRLGTGGGDITATLGPIPEPGTLMLLGTGLLGMLVRKRTRRPGA